MSKERCDNCHNYFEYSIVSTYAETIFLKRTHRDIEYSNFWPGYQPVLVSFDIGNGQYAYYCEECARLLGYPFPKRIK